jgi:hypothetical protein
MIHCDFVVMKPEVITGLDDYPLPPPLSGDAPIRTTVIKTRAICYDTLPL